MNINQVLVPLRQICGAAAVILAALALVKMSGLVPIRFGVIDLAIVGILCALVSR
jgi:hypothetical protein